MQTIDTRPFFPLPQIGLGTRLHADICEITVHVELMANPGNSEASGHSSQSCSGSPSSAKATIHVRTQILTVYT